jgi:hypothetical protein
VQSELNKTETELNKSVEAVVGDLPKAAEAKPEEPKKPEVPKKSEETKPAT